MFCKDDAGQKVDLGGGGSRQVMSHGGNLMAVEVDFEKDGQGAAHAHRHEQITYCASGSFRFFLEDKEYILQAGDTVYCASNLTHSVICLEAGRLVDVFTPIREDFL